MAITAIPPKSTVSSPAGAGDASLLVGKDGLTFKDVLDVVNPLQQLPLVSNVYRAASGDSISLLSRVAGGALVGGPLGAGLALVSGLFDAATGGEPLQHLASALKSGDPMEVAQETVARAPFASPPEAGMPSPLDTLTASVGDVRERAYQNAAASVLLETKMKTETLKG